MIRKSVIVLMSIFVVNVMVCSVGFALEIPDGFTINQDISDKALDIAKAQFADLKVQLQAMAAQGLPPDQQAMINQAIAVVDDKLDRLDRIDVYFSDPPESTPGEKYDDVYASYKSKLSLLNIENEEIDFLAANVPTGRLPQTTRDDLKGIVEGGRLKAAIGKSGKERISISTVYLDPTNNFAVMEKTTIVIATDN